MPERLFLLDPRDFPEPRLRDDVARDALDLYGRVFASVADLERAERAVAQGAADMHASELGTSTLIAQIQANVAGAALGPELAAAQRLEGVGPSGDGLLSAINVSADVIPDGGPPTGDTRILDEAIRIAEAISAQMLNLPSTPPDTGQDYGAGPRGPTPDQLEEKDEARRRREGGAPPEEGRPPAPAAPAPGRGAPPPAPPPEEVPEREQRGGGR